MVAVVTFRERETTKAKLDALREEIDELLDGNAAIEAALAGGALKKARLQLESARENVAMFPVEDEEQGELSDYEQC